MIRLKVQDKVRIIESAPERLHLLNHTGRVISIGGSAQDEIIVRLDRSNTTDGFLQSINFDSHHVRKQLEIVRDEQRS